MKLKETNIQSAHRMEWNARVILGNPPHTHTHPSNHKSATGDHRCDRKSQEASTSPYRRWYGTLWPPPRGPGSHGTPRPVPSALPASPGRPRSHGVPVPVPSTPHAPKTCPRSGAEPLILRRRRIPPRIGPRRPGSPGLVCRRHTGTQRPHRPRHSSTGAAPARHNMNRADRSGIRVCWLCSASVEIKD
jgi:hypothetical protein